MKTNKAIWYYAEGKSRNWESICPDFDLSVQGENFDEVYRELTESVLMYMEYVEDLPREEQARFLSCTAPVNLCLNFILVFLMTAFFKNRRNDSDCAGFLIHCRA